MEKRSIELALDLRPNSDVIARRAVQRLIGDDAPVAFVRDAVLLTSEVVNNVTRHTRGGCGLSAVFDSPSQWLRVDVEDTSLVIPVPIARPHEGGWGLRFLEQVAARWGITPSPHGKTVWFEIDRTSGAHTLTAGS